MPLAITRGASSVSGFGAFRTSLGAVNFLSVRTVTSSSLQYNNSFIDSAYNTYVTGYNASSYIPIEKINSTGVTTSFSNRVTGGTIGNDCYSYISSGACVDVDSSGNIYVGGTAGAGDGFTTAYATINAYNSSGTLLWQVTLQPGGQSQCCVQGIKYNPINGYVYVITDWRGSNNFSFAALDASTGTVVYNNRMLGYVGITSTSFYSMSNNMAIDSSGNVYVCYASGIYAGYLKINTSFAIQQFPVVTGLTGANYYAQCITLDSSGNVYIGTCFGTPYLQAIVIKFDSSGTYLWNATASLASTSLGFQAITTDSSGNVYCGGGGAAGNLGANSYILKFDSSGTIQYQRKFNSDTAPIRGLNMGPSNSMYFTGTFAAQKAFLGNLPTDGSKTGTYTVGASSIIYSAGSLTIGSETLTGTTLSTAFSGTATYATSTYATSSFTPTVSRAVI
jgi:hypothetical protein